MILGIVACARDPEAKKASYIASGDKYLESGRVSEAVIEYRNAVQQVPRAGDARLKLAEAYVLDGEIGRALDEYVRAADLLPDDSAVHVKTSGILLLGRRFDEARLWAEKVLAREPANLDAQILLANALAGLKDFESAVAEIEEAIKLNPNRGETYSNLGALELGRGQNDAAERAFKRAVEIDARSAAARLALANFYWAAARWAEAEEELKKVIELEPTHVLAHRALANYYIATNRASEAEPHFKQVHQLTKTPAAAFALADYYIASGDDPSARGVLDGLVGTRDSAGLAEAKLAALDRRIGRNEEAYTRVARVLDKDQTNLYALLAKTSFLASDGRLEEALSTVTLAAEKHQNSPAALFALGTIQASRRQTDAAITAYDSVLRLNPRATDAKIALARLHLSAGRADASIGLAQEAAATQPQNIAARLALVRALLAKRDLQKADVELAALAKQSPDQPAVETLQGVLKGMRKDNGGARRHFERALQLDASSLEALSGLVLLDINAGSMAVARARVDARVARGERDTAALMLAARTYAATGDPERAEVLLRRVIEVDPTLLDAYGALAQLYVTQKRLDEALVEFEALAKRQPRPVAALTFAGIILQGQGRTAEARNKFRQVLELDPDAPVAANNLAWLYADTGENMDLALELAMRAKAKLPDLAQVDDTIGWIHFKRDNPLSAIPYFERSIEKETTNAVYHYHLGLALVKAGQSNRARQSLERAIALKLGSVDATDAQRLLAGL
jgi:tetratricopeptide (TPR) repeat protein